jgi:hypothetical protein
MTVDVTSGGMTGGAGALLAGGLLVSPLRQRRSRAGSLQPLALQPAPLQLPITPLLAPPACHGHPLRAPPLLPLAATASTPPVPKPSPLPPMSPAPSPRAQATLALGVAPVCTPVNAPCFTPIQGRWGSIQGRTALTQEGTLEGAQEEAGARPRLEETETGGAEQALALAQLPAEHLAATAQGQGLGQEQERAADTVTGAAVTGADAAAAARGEGEGEAAWGATARARLAAEREAATRVRQREHARERGAAGSADLLRSARTARAAAVGRRAAAADEAAGAGEGEGERERAAAQQLQLRRALFHGGQPSAEADGCS